MLSDSTKLRAEFVMDAEGAPIVDTSSDAGRVYTIRLFVENAPGDVYAVTYELDESYYDRTREVRRGPAFEETITSYGDYLLRAHVRGKRGVRVVSERLAEALSESHGEDISGSIKRALADIAEH